MRALRDIGNAFAVALLSIGLMIGALSISLVSFIPEEAPTPTQDLIYSPPPVTATNTLPPTPEPLVTLTAVQPTETLVPPTSCPPPVGWIPYTIQYGDTPDSVAAKFNTNAMSLKGGNCLVTNELIPGKIVYVPPAPTSTTVVCNPGASGWVHNYTVRHGDTLFNIALRYGTTAGLLRMVNCHPSDLIYEGNVLWVPNVPTITPTFTPLPGVTYTAAPSLTQPFTQTVLPFTLTVPATQTSIPSTPTPTSTVTPIPTETASPTAFFTSTP